MAEHTAHVFEAQSDWLTFSAHTFEGAADAYHFGSQWAEEEIAEGAKIRPFRLMGYSGFQAGRVRVGARDGATLIQLSGQRAADHLDAALTICDTITRFDLAVTTRHDPPDPHIGANAYTLAKAYWDGKHHSALPSRIVDGRGGETVYLGDRSSDCFFRLYNKAAESAQSGDKAAAERYAHAWRAELELKGPMAAAVARAHASSPDRGAHAQGYVHGYLRSHGIQPHFDYDGNRVLIPGFRRRSDLVSRLEWFQRSVRPAVSWALTQTDRERILDALGLGPSGDGEGGEKERY